MLEGMGRGPAAELLGRSVDRGGGTRNPGRYVTAAANRAERKRKAADGARPPHAIDGDCDDDVGVGRGNDGGIQGEENPGAAAPLGNPSFLKKGVVQIEPLYEERLYV